MSLFKTTEKYILEPVQTAVDERDFQEVLENSLDKANLMVGLEYAKISDELVLVASHTASGLEFLGERVVQLDAVIRKIFHTLVESVRKFERESSWFVARLQRENFATADLEKLLMMLGLAWSRLRQSSARAGDVQAAWTPPETFVRETAKYWVKPEHLVRLKTEIVKHLPYLVFGQTVQEQQRELLSEESLLASELREKSRPQLITSVYFDSLDGLSYHERLLRKEGARLLRLRWYGKNEGNADKEIFVERKIHRESWTKLASSKDRFVLSQGLVSQFLAQTYLPENVPLAVEVQNMISCHRLRPMVRTCYFRSAFQEQDSNAVRISLDTNLTLINEISSLATQSGNSSSPSWCRSADDVLSAADIVKFPYAVLEIKLQDGGNPPVWVSELLRKAQAVRVHKFSKFIHGMALIHSARVREFPHWASLSAGPSDASPLLDMGSLEPKSLFANERTFLHYALKGVYLLLLTAGSPVSAMLVAAYVLWCLMQFFARAQKIMNKRAVEGGVTRLDVAAGPAAVVAVVGASLLSLLLKQ